MMPNARQIAVDLLYQLESSRNTLDMLLERAEPLFDQLDRVDRALAHALIFGVARWQGQLDWFLGELLQRPGKKLDPWIRIVLRMGLFQILHLDRIPNSAAVNTAVDLVKANDRKWAAGFVNGVLRTATRKTRPTTPGPEMSDDPVAGLAVRHAFPSWLIARWIHRWGFEQTQSLCMALNRIPPVTLRTNTTKTTRDALIDALAHEVKSILPALHSPEGIHCVAPARPIKQWDAYAAGWFQVQGEAAQLVSHYLQVRPGQRVWDACAGMGTKTAHLAQLMNNHGELTATDLASAKLQKLDADLKRLGISCVRTRRLDLEHADRLNGLPLFDRILIDAPCTGLGVLQKNPDGKWRTRAADIGACAAKQLTLLTNAASHLRPDGRLVYAVCSLEPEENEGVVESFLQKHPDFVIDSVDISSLMNTQNLMTSKGFLRTLPHRHQMDGFFAAALKRRNQP